MLKTVVDDYTPRSGNQRTSRGGTNEIYKHTSATYAWTVSNTGGLFIAKQQVQITCRLTYAMAKGFRKAGVLSLIRRHCQESGNQLEWVLLLLTFHATYKGCESVAREEVRRVAGHPFPTSINQCLALTPCSHPRPPRLTQGLLITKEP